MTTNESRFLPITIDVLKQNNAIWINYADSFDNFEDAKSHAKAQQQFQSSPAATSYAAVVEYRNDDSRNEVTFDLVDGNLPHDRVDYIMQDVYEYLNGEK